MSEVADACQVLLVSGRMIATTAGLSLKMALLMMKIYNSLYLGKWKGNTNFRRFRAIKGDDYEFVNVCSENPEQLMEIEKEMEAHNLLFARLPDLCGGDGNTQYVVARSDMHIFAAFLMDHTHGELKNVKVGPITESDYAKTAVHPESGKYTQEFKDLNESARAQYRLLLTDQHSERGQTVPALPLHAGVEQKKEREGSFSRGKARRCADEVNADMIEDRGMEIQPWNGPRQLQITDRAGTREAGWDDIFMHQQLRIRNERLYYKDQMHLIYDAPVKEHDNWAMFPIHDGEQVVVIPRADILEGNITREKHFRAAPDEMLPKAMFYTNRDYIVVNLRTGSRSIAGGRDLLAKMRMPDLDARKEQLENLAKNIQRNVGTDAVLPQTVKHRGR